MTTAQAVTEAVAVGRMQAAIRSLPQRQLEIERATWVAALEAGKGSHPALRLLLAWSNAELARRVVQPQ